MNSTVRQGRLPACKHAFTDGRGNYAVTDNDTAAAQLQPGSERRPLHIIYRNAR